MSYCKRCGAMGHYAGQCPVKVGAPKADPVDWPGEHATYAPGRSRPESKITVTRGPGVTAGNARVHNCPSCQCAVKLTGAEKQRAYRRRKSKSQP